MRNLIALALCAGICSMGVGESKATVDGAMPPHPPANGTATAASPPRPERVAEVAGKPPASPTAGVRAVRAEAFLQSTGINTHIDQGVWGSTCIGPLKYLGVRNIRDGSRRVADLVLVRNQTNVQVDLITGGDLDAAIATAKTLHNAGALLSLEGPNEVNNFPIVYKGKRGGGTGSWAPVADYQRDLHHLVSGDPALKSYPVFANSEAGAETDNVGLQFLTIPAGTGTVMPDGSRYADFANTHNYVSGNGPVPQDNMAWQAADPTLNGVWDSLYGEYGVTWNRRFQGYDTAALRTLPRVTTETGWDSVSGQGGEDLQGKMLVNTYLSQFKRGWAYTFVYMLRDGEGGEGHQGVFHEDSSPKLAAAYIHNLTSILADEPTADPSGTLDYAIADAPGTVHDLLMQKANGTFELAVWSERLKGSDAVTVALGGRRSSVKVYDVTAGAVPVQVLHDVSTVSLTMSDHAFIIEVAS